jgi:hypothetical protein
MSYFNIPERPIEPPESTLRVAFECAICEKSIYEGDDYYNIPDLGNCCEECIDDCKRYSAEACDDGSDYYYDVAREEAML